MLGRCETCASEIDAELLIQLKEWRLRTAQELKVPAFVVFSDNTLIAIAETRPPTTRRWSRSRGSGRASSSSSVPMCSIWSTAAA